MGENEVIPDNAFLLVGGTVVNQYSIEKKDLAFNNGKIEAIGNLKQSNFDGYRVINANGKYILPGGIDPHVHLSLPTPAGNSSDDFISGSRAALSGGTTSIIDFVTPRHGQSLVSALQLRRIEAGRSLCNWKLHLGISEWNEKVKDELLYCLRNEGITSIKAYLAYTDTIGITISELREVMELVAGENGIVLVHCESGELINEFRKKFIQEKKTQAFYHPLSRPAETEIESIREVIELSEETNCPVYIVHTSTGKGAELILEAKQRGLRVSGETCIQYLILTDEVYEASKSPEEILPYIISPPIRSQQQQLHLWEALKNGTFDTVATDHCPFNLHGQKDAGLHDFTRIPNGAGGIEYRLSLLYTYGVLSGILDMQQFVKLTSSNAAELFGWANSKGKLVKGYDADLIVWNPNTTGIINRETQVQCCDSNIYEGIPVKGKAEWVFIGGKML
ncbi:MAG: dihydropyrimidinase [Bacteroidetes bacterium]|nr:dihydropyrimidinase [Bacteroidota bacterium]